MEDEMEEDLPSHEILRENLKRRKVRAKLPKAEPKCKICGKIYTEQGGLTKHMQLHNSDHPYECPHCDYRAKTKGYISRHIKRVHTGPPTGNRCRQCGKTFHFPSALANHERVHTGEKPYACDVCGKTFSAKYSLDTHKLIHSDEKPFKCLLCPYACRDSSTLRKHRLRHAGAAHVFVCEFCNGRFDSKTRLREHELEVHLQPDVRAHKCTKCTSTFKNAKALKIHIKVVHNRATACECPVCGATLSSRHGLAQHARRHLRLRPYRCAADGCRQAFKDPSCLKKHSRIHNTASHVICDVCGRTFSCKPRLAKHLRQHKPRAKTAPCALCGVKFYTQRYVDKHMKEKHGATRARYECDACGFTAPTKPSLALHIKAHVKRPEDKEGKCTVCGRVYRRKDFLRKHYWNEHRVRVKRLPRIRGVKPPPSPVQVKMEPPDSPEAPRAPSSLLQIDKEEPFAGFESSEQLDFDLEDEQTLNALLDRAARERQGDFDTSDDKIEPKSSNEASSQETISPTTSYRHDITFEDDKELLKQNISENALTDDITNDVKDLEDVTRENDSDLQQQKTANAVFEREKSEDVEVGSETTVKQREKAGVYVKNLLQLQASNKTDDQPLPAVYNGLVTSLDESLPGDCEKVLIETSVDDDNQPKSSKEDDNSEGDMMQATRKSDKLKKYSKAIENIETSQRVGTQSKTSTEDNPKPETSTEVVTNPLGTSEIESQPSTSTAFTSNLVSNKTKTEYKKIRLVTSSKVTKKRKTTFKGVTKISKVAEYNKSSLKELTTTTEDYLQSDSDGRSLKEPNSKGGEKRTFMHVDEFLQSVIGNDDDVGGKKKDETMIVDQSAEEEVKRRVRDMLLKAPPRPPTRFGRRLAVYTREEIEEIEKKKAEEAAKEAEKEDQDPRDEEDQGRKEKDKIPEPLKAIWNMHQCYICFKLFETKPKLIDHCQTHFDVCNETTLKKCPLCPYVTTKSDIKKHLKIKHKQDVNISYMNIKDRKDNDKGSRYYYDTRNDNIKELEIIPSIKILNKKASMEIDRKNREYKNKLVAKPKLVRKGKEWIVVKEKIDLSNHVLPDSKVLDKNSEDYLETLKKLANEAKKKGRNMLYPCNRCEKVCQNLSALTLHFRRHDPNPKPFKPRGSIRKDKEKRMKLADNTPTSAENRLADPKPIVNNHKCDPKLMEFYENNIKGGDIEFWQFLKIYNKMNKEKVNSFEDLEERTEFGIHYSDKKTDTTVEIETNSQNDKTVNDDTKDNDNNDNTNDDLVTVDTVSLRKKAKETANKTRKRKEYLPDKKFIGNRTYLRTIRITKVEYNKRLEIKNKLRQKFKDKS